MKNSSRRDLCKSAFSIGIVTILLGPTSRADALQSQASVSYQNMPSDGQQCSLCKNFMAGGSAGSCKIVAGVISPTGYCVAFEPI